jgi:hypothetical protein
MSKITVTAEALNGTAGNLTLSVEGEASNLAGILDELHTLVKKCKTTPAALNIVTGQ